jgi:hypothetical protein
MSDKRGDTFNRSPVLFAALWFGIPICLVVASALIMGHFGF